LPSAQGRQAASCSFAVVVDVFIARAGLPALIAGIIVNQILYVQPVWIIVTLGRKMRKEDARREAFASPLDRAAPGV
jgi:hypothetical protein